VLAPHQSSHQIHRIQNYTRRPVVYHGVTIHVASFAVGRGRRQLLDHRHGKRLHSLLPPWRKSSCSEVLFSQPGRQTLSRIISAQKDAVLRPEIPNRSWPVVRSLVVFVMEVVTSPFLLSLSMPFVIRAEKRHCLRYCRRRQNTAKKDSPFHLYDLLRVTFTPQRAQHHFLKWGAALLRRHEYAGVHPLHRNSAGAPRFLRGKKWNPD
jgi:hypothetical protein